MSRSLECGVRSDSRLARLQTQGLIEMQIRPRLEAVIEDMLDGHILLDEALEEFEKLYIEKAYTRNKKRISHTAAALGIHRNTISKRVNSYRIKNHKPADFPLKRLSKRHTH